MTTSVAGSSTGRRDSPSIHCPSIKARVSRSSGRRSCSSADRTRCFMAKSHRRGDGQWTYCRKQRDVSCCVKTASGAAILRVLQVHAVLLRGNDFRGVFRACRCSFTAAQHIVSKLDSYGLLPESGVVSRTVQDARRTLNRWGGLFNLDSARYRNAETGLDSVHYHHRLEALDVRVVIEELPSELFVLFHVAGGHNQDEVGITGDVVAAHDFRRGANRLFKGVDDVCALAFQRDQHQHHHVAPDCLRRYHRNVRLDDALRPQTLEPALNTGAGQTHQFAKLITGYPVGTLQFTQQ